MSHEKDKCTSSLIELVWDLGFLFAVPLVIFALGGRFLDKRMDSSPLYVLIGVLVAAIVSSIGVFFKVRSVLRENQDETPRDSDTTHST